MTAMVSVFHAVNDGETVACTEKNFIAVRIECWAQLLPHEQGTDPNGECPDYDHEWDDKSDAACQDCGWRGTAGQLVLKDAPDEDEEDE